MPKLHPHIGVPARKCRVLPALATIAILLVVEGLNVPGFHAEPAQKFPAVPLETAHAERIPVVLSASDIAHYKRAFALQRAGQMAEADAAAAQAEDPLLQGVLLGERYLLAGHRPNFSELALWLARYGDHAQAGDLYRLAQTRAPEDAGFLTEPHITATLKGFSNGHDRSALAGEKQWVWGLAAFRRHDPHAALAHFEALLAAGSDDLSSDDYAAVAFWAYRAAAAAGDGAEATRCLNKAAELPPGFYSILARQVAGGNALALAQPEEGDITSFLHKAAIRRAIALKAVGEDALAEKELRALYPASGKEDRKRLVQLARMLNLPAAQMRMVFDGDYDAGAKEEQYPMPRWMPKSGYRVEPALLFAIMRQESGFNPNAKSASGAIGVMQLMPATAHAMAQDSGLEQSREPAVSMSLGQHYLEHLMEVSSISDNLVYIIGAYNAGPGTLANWQKSLHAGDDPLLFIESIPSVQARDYIVRVMGNYWVYSEMMGSGENGSLRAMAQNRWPHYERAGRQTVAMLEHLDAGGPEQ